VSVLKWKDKKEVTLISTYHGEETRMKLTKCKQEKRKPVSVLDYNENMGGVDLKDQLLQPYLSERKKNWYRHYSLNMEVKVSGNFKAIIPQTKMCRDLLKDVFQKKYHRQKKRSATKRCVVCYKNNRRKETVFWCHECEAVLCVSYVSRHFTPS